MGGDPASDTVGDDPEHLVEEEQEGDGQGAVPQVVEVQHHQHVDGAVGEREAPIGPRHNQVSAQSLVHDYIVRAILRASSIIRFT